MQFRTNNKDGTTNTETLCSYTKADLNSCLYLRHLGINSFDFDSVGEREREREREGGRGGDMIRT
jgi:hypothetical protein